MENNGQVSTTWLINRAIKSINNIKLSSVNEDSEIVREIRDALNELESIRIYFDTVNEPDLIDYAIYREKAAIIKLSYLLKKAKCKAGA
ncbi:hypothetical protein Q428_10025 [Fervidicella metallireducens AeB]|uniref:Uncharacterized protein n=1 Tax=Fervidicella metallireducens AeB TaxID=1403537 RepID=A0A017RVY9_9CLOT|nr:DUF2508 family protein [Fervidicella metallireducens]EYE88055.1 hypothetical protein Q428_10025 [Fervidicella metallireducens AeB]